MLQPTNAGLFKYTFFKTRKLSARFSEMERKKTARKPLLIRLPFSCEKRKILINSN